VNQPEPELKGPSVTIKATEDRIQQMHREADQIWPPELAQLMKVGPQPLHSAVIMLFESMLVPFSVLLFFSFLRLRTSLVSLVGSCVSMEAIACGYMGVEARLTWHASPEWFGFQALGFEH